MQQPCHDCSKPFDTDDRELCCFCFKVDGLCTECLTKHEEACAEELDMTPSAQPPDEIEDPTDHFEEMCLHKEVMDYDDDKYDSSGAEGLGDPAGDGGDISGMETQA